MLKKARVLILAVMTATVMLLGSSAVFGAATTGGTPTDMPNNGVPISKTVKVAEGITFNETITVTATQQATNYDGVVPPETGKTFTGTIAVTEANTSTAATGAIDFSSLTKPGEYTFLVKETDETTTSGGTWSVVDDSEYYLQVLVKSDGTQQYAISTDGAFDTTNNKKVDTAAFTNTYVKTASLTIAKAVVNPEYVDADTLYPFTITFTAPVTGTISTDGYSVSDVTKAYSDSDGTTALTNVKSGDTVYLKADGSFKINGLPAGATYTLVEGDVTNADTTIDCIENGEAKDTVSGTTLSDAKIGEGANSATVTNTYKQISVTGIITTYLPYIAMILLALAALALYVVSKRRRAARY